MKGAAAGFSGAAVQGVCSAALLLLALVGYTQLLRALGAVQVAAQGQGGIEGSSPSVLNPNKA